jgi:hypothetical protein
MSAEFNPQRFHALSGPPGQGTVSLVVGWRVGARQWERMRLNTPAGGYLVRTAVDAASKRLDRMFGGVTGYPGWGKFPRRWARWSAHGNPWRGVCSSASIDTVTTIHHTVATRDEKRLLKLRQELIKVASKLNDSQLSQLIESAEAILARGDREPMAEARSTPRQMIRDFLHNQPAGAVFAAWQIYTALERAGYDGSQNAVYKALKLMRDSGEVESGEGPTGTWHRWPHDRP